MNKLSRNLGLVIFEKIIFIRYDFGVTKMPRDWEWKNSCGVHDEWATRLLKRDSDFVTGNKSVENTKRILIKRAALAVRGVSY